MNARRLLIVVPAAIALAYYAFTISAAGVARYDNPELALQLMPYDAVANAMMADKIARGGVTPASEAEITALSKRALERSALSPVAMRLLGFIAGQQGNPTLARARVQAAAMLSQRDTATQLWLINDAVARQDLDTALYRYDVAMRVSTAARASLFPVLANAATDPELIGPLARTLDKSPNWMTDFIVTTVQSGVATENMAAIAERIGPHGSPSDRQISETLVNRLIAEGRYATVARFMDSPMARSARSGGSASAALLGSFRDTDGIAPFTWTYAHAAAQDADPTATGLNVFADAGQGGVVASRQLLLKPGRYRFRTKGRATGRIVWTLNCSNASDDALVSHVVPTDGHLREVGNIVISPSCPAPTLHLSVYPDDNGPTVTGHIEMVAITPDTAPKTAT